MHLHQKQEEAIRNKARFKVLNWGRRSGKTTEFAYEALGTALSINGSQTTYYAQTFDDARAIAWDIFLETFGDAVIEKNETRLEITLKNIHGGKSYVSLKGWESVYHAGKGRGTENDLLLCDEVAFCRGFISTYEKVLEPTLLTSKGRAVFGSTPNGFNDFYTLAQRAQNSEGWWYSHATSYDNPHNDPSELERLRTTKTEDSFAQEYLADFRKMQGLVYKEFDMERHTYSGKHKKEVRETIAGVDFGYTNPMAALKIEVDSDAHYYISDEYYEKQRTTAQLIGYIKPWNPRIVYPDPAEPDRIQELGQAGLNCYDVSKDVEAGIDKVRELFKAGRIHISRDCANLIWELQNYSYPEKRADRNEYEAPIKENDHALDALRYALYMHSPSQAPENPFVIQRRRELVVRNDAH